MIRVSRDDDDLVAALCEAGGQVVRTQGSARLRRIKMLVKQQDLHGTKKANLLRPPRGSGCRGKTAAVRLLFHG